MKNVTSHLWDDQKKDDQKKDGVSKALEKQVVNGKGVDDWIRDGKRLKDNVKQGGMDMQSRAGERIEDNVKQGMHQIKRGRQI